jgi:hypothetical protein
MSKKVLLIFLSVMFVISGIAASDCSAFNTNPPTSPVNLIFIHHSCGENWLDDGNGGLGIALRDNNYYVSDTNYGWGDFDGIGSNTDIGHWWDWFRGPNSSIYMSELYNENEQASYYSRLATGPGGENNIIMFKSCYPNSDLAGDPSDPVPPIGTNPLKGNNSWSDYHTISNAKGIYIDILEYFRTRQDKLFIVVTAPPVSYDDWANNARAFNNWLVNDWLRDYSYRNVAVFDFYNVLTTNGGDPNTNDLGVETGNHHRFWNSTVQHVTSGDNDSSPNILEYPTEDDHPSMAGNLKATAEYLPLLNIYYHCWQGTGACPQDVTTSPIIPDITANYADGPLTITADSWLQIMVSLNPGSSAGTNADFWVAVDTPFGWHYYMYPSGWYYASDLSYLQPAHQGALFSLGLVELLNITGLPVGTYTFYFAVDTIMNGQIDFSNLSYDSVIVHVVAL